MIIIAEKYDPIVINCNDLSRQPARPPPPTSLTAYTLPAYIDCVAKAATIAVCRPGTRRHAEGVRAGVRVRVHADAKRMLGTAMLERLPPPPPTRMYETACTTE